MFMEAFSIIAKTGKQTKGPLTEDKDIVHKYNGVLPSHYKEWNNAICSNMDGARNCHQKRQWHPTPVLLPGKSHGRRSLVGCSPGGHEELDTTERLHVHFSLSCIGEGNGNPLQCSCLENPRDGEPGGLPSMGLHRVGHDWCDLAAAAIVENTVI